MEMRKVTVFITRNNNGQKELLLFKHPNAGIQIPAGTIEENELPEDAAIREVWEETGLEKFGSINYIGCHNNVLPQNKVYVVNSTPVFSRPDENSFQWASFRRGIIVQQMERCRNDFEHVMYKEYDSVEQKNYVSYEIVGWINKKSISPKAKRYFYHMEINKKTDDVWVRNADHHMFEMFWAPLNNLPQIIHPQDEWLQYVRDNLRYEF